jgi:hypothetical protein
MHGTLLLVSPNIRADLLEQTSSRDLLIPLAFLR